MESTCSSVVGSCQCPVAPRTVGPPLWSSAPPRAAPSRHAESRDVAQVYKAHWLKETEPGEETNPSTLTKINYSKIPSFAAGGWSLPTPLRSPRPPRTQSCRPAPRAAAELRSLSVRKYSLCAPWPGAAALPMPARSQRQGEQSSSGPGKSKSLEPTSCSGRRGTQEVESLETFISCWSVPTHAHSFRGWQRQGLGLPLCCGAGLG